MIKIDKKEWDRGFLAGYNGEPLNDGDLSASSGYVEGKAKRDGYASSYYVQDGQVRDRAAEAKKKKARGGLSR